MLDTYAASQQETAAVVSSEKLVQAELTGNGELPQTGTPSKRENRVQFTHTAG